MAVKSDIQGPLTLSGKELAVGEMVPRRALHKEYLGNLRGGIAPLGRYKAILAFTGASGETHGYQDQWLSDGTFRYYGEGQVGHMKMTAGNLAIDTHVESGSRLFLFDMNSERSGYVFYKGEFRKVRRGEDIGPDRERRDRRRYFFDLTPVNGRGVESDVDRQSLFDEGRDREISGEPCRA